MARILYGLCGVGVGHGMRGKVVIDHLKKENKLLVITSQVNYKYLKRHFNFVKNVGGLELVARGNVILEILTYIRNLRKLSWKNYLKMKKSEEIVNKFKPEVVISDWEPNSSFAAKRLGVPLICLDNMHYIKYGRYTFPINYIRVWLVNRFVLGMFMAKAKYYLIMLLPGSRLQKIKNKEGVIRVKPAMRDEILKAGQRTRRIGKRGEHVLVYQSLGGSEKLFNVLQNIDEEFIIYGCGKKRVMKNLVFKEFNDGKEYIDDLVNAKAVITNGGFNLISEAIHLRKPLLVIPIKKHFEQTLNGLYVEESGLGECCLNLNNNTKLKIKEFLDNLNKYKIIKTKQTDNSELFGLLGSIIKKEAR